MGAKIKSVHATEIQGTRGPPAIETIVMTEDGASGRATVEAGASVGAYEVKFVYDGGQRYNGLGVLKAVEIVNNIVAPTLKGMDVTKQRSIDDALIKLDGTTDKSRLGGNSMASVSAAVLKAAASSAVLPLYQYIGGVNTCILPVPDSGAFGGSTRYGGGAPGKVTGGKPSHEFVCYGFKTFSEASYAGWEVSKEFARPITEKFNLPHVSGQEWGAYRSLDTVLPKDSVQHDRELWNLMVQAIEDTGYRNRIGIQIDVAANAYFDEGKNKYVGLFSSEEKTREDLVELYKEVVKSYPLMILEDPLDENDFEGHAVLTRELGIEIVGDDLFTTNPKRLQQGIEVGAANTMLLKVNQVGTITEAFDAVQLAYRNSYGVMPCSSRGEGEVIADYTVGLGTGHMRGGSRLNRLHTIEAELGNNAKFLGKLALKVKYIP